MEDIYFIKNKLINDTAEETKMKIMNISVLKELEEIKLLYENGFINKMSMKKNEKYYRQYLIIHNFGDDFNKVVFGIMLCYSIGSGLLGNDEVFWFPSNPVSFVCCSFLYCY